MDIPFHIYSLSMLGATHLCKAGCSVQCVSLVLIYSMFIKPTARLNLPSVDH